MGEEERVVIRNGKCSSDSKTIFHITWKYNIYNNSNYFNILQGKLQIVKVETFIIPL
jgi:hypothetical protein